MEPWSLKLNDDYFNSTEEEINIKNNFEYIPFEFMLPFPEKADDYRSAQRIFTSKRIELSLLHKAVMRSDTKLIYYLLHKNVDVNSNLELFGTPLHVAVRKRNLEIVEILINAGADVNVQDPGRIPRWTPLQLAIKGGCEKIAKLLIKNGAEVNEVFIDRSIDGEPTPLLMAVQSNNEKMVKLLLTNNADLNTEIQYVGSPLNVAIRTRSLKMIGLLFTNGAHAIYCDYIFIKSEYPNFFVKFEDLNAILLSLNHSNINVYLSSICDYSLLFSDYSLLHRAIESANNYDIIKHILETGVDFVISPSEDRSYLDPSTNSYKARLSYIIKEHIVKLSMANLYVNIENLAAVNSAELNELRDQCIKETEQMKKMYIDMSNLTYYDVLHRSIHELAVSLTHVDDDDKILCSDTQSIFPLYGGIINDRLEKAIRRRTLLFNAYNIVYNIFAKLNLPDIFVRQIFQFLTNIDLENLDDNDTSLIKCLM